MRAIIHPKLVAGRVRCGDWWSDDGDGLNGAFEIMGPCGCRLRIISSAGTDPLCDGFEHVSVSTVRRTPNWEEMCFVKSLFWTDEETVIQFHPPKSEYVNYHPFCLHLWRDVRNGHRLPPSILVGPKQEAVE